MHVQMGDNLAGRKTIVNADVVSVWAGPGIEIRFGPMNQAQHLGQLRLPELEKTRDMSGRYDEGMTFGDRIGVTHHESMLALKKHPLGRQCAERTVGRFDH